MLPIVLLLFDALKRMFRSDKYLMAGVKAVVGIKAIDCDVEVKIHRF